MALTRLDTDLWSAETELPWQFGLVPIPIRMTVLRLGDGRLVLHSPVELDPALREELDRLGPVGFIVIPWAHGKFAEQAARAYPGAELLASSKPPRGRESLPFRGSLADGAPPAWAGQIETHFVRGFRLLEVVLFQRSSRTLVITDLAFNIQSSPYRWARSFLRANGMWRRFGPSRILRALAVSDRRALRESLERIARWDFERIVPAHGEVLEHAGPADLLAAWLG